MAELSTESLPHPVAADREAEFTLHIKISRSQRQWLERIRKEGGWATQAEVVISILGMVQLDDEQEHR